MGESYWVVTVVLAVLIGIGIALRITEHCITKSNNVGDYTGKFYDYCREFEVVGESSYEKNKKETPKVQRIKSVMAQRREDAKKVKKVNGRIIT
jgi:hypothetical protein